MNRISSAEASASTEPANASNTELIRSADARRPKPKLSCTVCRAKKLKCDRKHPCTNCSKRPPESCSYNPHHNSDKGSATFTRSQSGNVHDRIQHLERIVICLAKSSAKTGEEVRGITDLDVGTSDIGTSGAVQESSTSINAIDPQVANPVPHLSVDDAESPSITASHWDAILKDTAGIKDELETYRSSEAWNERVTKPDELTGPQLLFGGYRDIEADELICSLPSKVVVDELANIFFQEIDISSLILHVPTFLKECEACWDNHQAVSLPWLSMLYSVLSSALHFVVHSGRTVKGILFPESTSHMYTSRAAQCLIVSDYARPTEYTVEAMMMYLSCEHFWHRDGHFRASLVFSTTVRLAIRAGYHRDPVHYPQMSVFKAEMRRRMWAFIVQFDLLLAFKCGLPRVIDDRSTDVSPPLNVRDEDLYPEMIVPPKARLETEQTSIGYLVYKTRLLAVLGQIINQTTSSKGLSYNEILILDKDLILELSTRPVWLEPPVDEGHITLSPLDMKRRIDIDLVAQRARMILHRKFLVLGRRDKHYSFSRKVCLEAAMKTLRHQRKLYDISCNHHGDIKISWRFLSLMSHDSLLAAMLICLDIDQELESRELLDNAVSRGRFDEDEVQEYSKILQSAYEIWSGFFSYGSGARKGVEVLGIMLEKVRRYQEVSSSYGSASGTECPPGQSGSIIQTYPCPPAQPHETETGTPASSSLLQMQGLFQDSQPMVSSDGATSVEEAGSSFYGQIQGAKAVPSVFESFSTTMDWMDWDFGHPSTAIDFN